MQLRPSESTHLLLHLLSVPLVGAYLRLRLSMGGYS